MPVFEFTDDKGFPITIKAESIIHVSRPKGNFKGELTIDTGTKWGFGGKDPMAEYKRAKATFEHMQAMKKLKGES